MPEPSAAADLEELRTQVLAFVGSCKQPILKEADSEPLVLSKDHFTVEVQGRRLLLQAWDDRRSVVRRILRLRSAAARSIALVVHRFGTGEGTVTIADTTLRGGDLERDQVRQRFRERFRKMLSQQFPGWKVEKLAAERDLRRTFSERYARGLLRQGRTEWAAIGVAESEGEAAHVQVLTDGLLWLDHLRRDAQRRESLVRGLYLFVPRQNWRITANRLAFLDAERAGYSLFTFTDADKIELVDPQNFGNVHTELSAPRSSAGLSAGVRELLRPLASFPGVEEEVTADGELSLRLRGLEVVHATFDAATFLEQPLTPDGAPEALQALEELARIRSADSAAPHHPFYTRAPERWLESLLKSRPSALSLDLGDAPVYSQTFSVAGPARGLIDLLTIDKAGRLVVIEIKADEDPQLPLQALDYWIRAKWHLERGEFQTHGYFHGLELRPDPPLLWLVFPSIRLHAATEVLLKYVSPEVPVARLGVNEDWRRGVHVVYRA